MDKTVPAGALPASEATTEKLPSNYWKPAWRTGLTLAFTAGANEPLLTFAATTAAPRRTPSPTATAP
ncbi:hypothetical protein [Streptomyces erythrochromogenes]|uniref:hypothetical protein n=1 Tax=Streptomyces erythrochromogenes TaxID=285574 RepID=UPI0037F6FFDC